MRKMVALLFSVGCAAPGEPGTVLEIGAFEREAPCEVCGPRAVVSPEFIDFGPVELGAALESELTVSNVGDAELVVERMVFQGPDDFRFEEVGVSPDVVADSFVRWLPPLRVPPGESRELSVRFEPIADLGVTGLLLLQTNEAPERPRPGVVVTGEGAFDCPLVAADEISFGSVPVDVEAMARIDVSGCVDTGVRVTKVKLALPSKVFEVELDGFDLPVSLLPHEVGSFHVRYTPEAADGEPDVVDLLITTTHHSAPVGVRLTGIGQD